MHRKRSLWTVVILLLLIPAVVVGGALLFRERHYAWVAICVALLSCLPLLWSFERQAGSSRELAILAVLIALSAAGRFVFAWLPGFKPVTAITVLVAIYLGREAGFVVGALSAVVSNFFFGQGPWTPFQMFAWGLIGFLAGVCAKPLRQSRVALCLFGGGAGVFFSLLMDVWTTLWADGTLLWSRYVAAAIAALPTTLSYAVSNVLFLLILARPFGEKLGRLQQKYGLFRPHTDEVSG